MQRPLFTAAAAATLLALASLAPAQAATQGTIIIQSGPRLEYRNLPPPPPPRAAHRPSARHGHVWVEGHWEWRGSRYRWIDGYWTKARRGYEYRQPHWVQRGGDWRFESGGWHRGRSPGMRDRDGDGIPNRYDRDDRRRGPAIRDRYDDGLRNDRYGDGLRNDRDGDGVRNRYDSHPNNPRRH